MINKKNHISSKLHTIYISSNNARHPFTKTFNTLHYTSPNYTSLYVNREAKSTAMIMVAMYWVEDRKNGVGLKSETKIFLTSTVSVLVFDTTEHPIRSAPTALFQNEMYLGMKTNNYPNWSEG